MANKRKNIQELKINTINLNPPIFIVGAEKSGTTLLRKILGKHHNIYEIKAETELFRKFKPPIYSYLNKLEKNKEFETLIKTMLTFLLYKHDGAVNSLLRKEYPGNVVELYKEIINLNELAELRNKYNVFNFCANFLTIKETKKRWVEKTPSHVRGINHILSYYPTAKIIIIYRDPRAVYASWKNYKRFKERYLSNIVICTLVWLIATEISLKTSTEFSSHLYQIRYEDLVADPIKEIKKLCDFIQEDFDPMMIDVDVVNSAYKEHEVQEGIQKKFNNMWAEKLTNLEILFIELITRKKREILGYPDVTDKNPIYTSMLLPLFVIYVTIQALVFILAKRWIWIKNNLMLWKK